MIPAKRRSNYIRTGREARVATIGWIVTLCWVVGVSWWLGQERPVTVWFGIPRWVILGVAFPWVATFFFNTWFSAFYLSEDNEAPVAPLREGQGKP